MAVQLGKSPIIMTAQGDTVADDGRNWKVTCMRFVAVGSSGTAIMYDRPGGREIARAILTVVGEAEDIPFDAHWFDGFYYQQNPSDGINAYLYYC